MQKHLGSLKLKKIALIIHAKYFDVNPKLILVIQHKPQIILQYPNHFFPCKYSFFEEYKRAVCSQVFSDDHSSAYNPIRYPYY